MKIILNDLLRTIKLYKIEDNDVSVVSEAPLKQEMLESDVSKYSVIPASYLYSSPFDYQQNVFRMLSLSMEELKESLSGLEG